MKTIPVENAAGTILCHDVTKIVPGEFKGPAFKRGHKVTPEDIPVLLDIGKANLYVYDQQDGYVHEDEAALSIARSTAGQHIEITGPEEGKATLRASTDGLLYINPAALNSLNTFQDVTMATLHSYRYVKKNEAVGATRVIPLAVPSGLLDNVDRLCSTAFPVVEVKPLRKAAVGIVTTGSEVYSGRIKDRFGPILKKKFNDLGSEIIEQIFVSDEVDFTARAITTLIECKADLIAVTGGMSVDPDDQTPNAIKQTGAEIVSYGAPTYPGAIFLLAYLNDVPIVGLPGCVMYHKASIFDLTIPRILAGEKLQRKDIVAFGYGGFCKGCDHCRFPTCDFGTI
ncbi:molybdopterin-binding protein [Desulforhopalus singaporensis]|uniref:Molybdopterin molybdenumtransferase n=1 Tax=Desulforhopalus singaporensis TaxID=91360 RepID=A0A1H0UAM8_9BACT|nr:molybdopterin-binding protein [Desulforhopalus singaporensis]SDP63229.1 molybdenum cofactor synthesis domain-containing protein [Desulforhopalus singaporensis]